MYKKASRLKLRIQTIKGLVSVEDLWDFSLQGLNTIAKTLNKELKTEAEDDFLGEKSEQDTLTKLRFDIVLDILNTKKNEANAAKLATADKAHNQKILQIIASKQDEELVGLSIEELQKKLK